jgi:hypothetical protein
MNGLDFIQTKQVAWAKRNNIPLIGSQVTKGAKNYTENLDDNFFEKLTHETILAIKGGDGGELTSVGGNPTKMNALHSSSALGVNIFQYWKSINKVSDIAFACGLCASENKNSINITFEEKFVISNSFPKAPNIDVVIHNTNDSDIKAFGIECKFSEAYGSREHSGLKEKYLVEIPDQWVDIPNIFEFAKTKSPDYKIFHHLHPAQLFKHILGLKRKYGKKHFRLLYLWYDVYGTDGAGHRKEIETFKEIAKKDDVMIHSLSYQELICKLANQFYDGNEKYVDYITDRYL